MVQRESVNAASGKVSILMGIYNCADTLGEAIESILCQTYTNWELILCDDCSTDDTYKVAEGYRERYPEKIILLRNEANAKLAFTLNHCLANASGEFAARMDGDDKSAPERFQKQVDFLRTHPDVDLVGTAMQRFSDDGSLGAIVRCPKSPDKDTPYACVPFNHATVMTYRRVYDALGGYTVCPRTVRGQDRDLWYRFFAAGYRGANLSEALYKVRENEAAIRRRSAKVRWNSFKTDMIGYRMLHYPWYRYARPVMRLMKIFVPVCVVEWYRNWETKKSKKQEH